MERTGEGGKGKLKEALKVALKGQHSDANGTDLESTAHTTACVWLQLCLSPSPLAMIFINFTPSVTGVTRLSDSKRLAIHTFDLRKLHTMSRIGQR